MQQQSMSHMIKRKHDDGLTHCDTKSRRIQQIGTPEEIYRHPVNEFVATFIGSPSMNIIPLTYHMDAWYFDAQKVADQSVVQLSSHSQCRLGIRPEDLHLITNDDSRAYPIQLTNLKSI